MDRGAEICRIITKIIHQTTKSHPTHSQISDGMCNPSPLQFKKQAPAATIFASSPICISACRLEHLQIKTGISAPKMLYMHDNSHEIAREETWVWEHKKLTQHPGGLFRETPFLSSARNRSFRAFYLCHDEIPSAWIRILCVLIDISA